MKGKILIGLVIAGGCLWLVLRNIAWPQVWSALTSVHYEPLALGIVMMLFSYWFRARRWKVLLRPIRRISVGELFAINAVGFLAINALPLRLGEMTRPILLKRRHQIPISTGLAAVMVERVFDGLATVLALAIGLLAAPKDLGDMPSIGMGLRMMTFVTLGIYAPILAFLVLAVTNRDRALRVLQWVTRILPHRHQKHAFEIAINFFEGLRSLPDFKSFLWIFLESLGVWGSVAVTYALAIHAFQLHIPGSAAFTILGVSAVGVMLPSAPGFVGTFQLFVVASLALYGVSKSTSLAYSIVVHAMNLGFTLLVGLACTPRVTTKIGSLMSESMHSSAPETAQ